MIGCGGNLQPDVDTSFTIGGELCSIDNDRESVCCKLEAQQPVPSSVITVIDLSSVDDIPVGTCGTYLYPEEPRRRGYVLPSDPAAYPLKVILPRITGVDPRCASTCGDTPPATAFGIAMVSEGLIGYNTGRAFSIVVPPPWKFVSGGCGEACAWPCIGGYQEFGIRSCTVLAFGDFGFATEDPAAASVEALIDLVTLPATPGEWGPSSCCLFRSAP